MWAPFSWLDSRQQLLVVAACLVAVVVVAIPMSRDGVVLRGRGAGIVAFELAGARRAEAVMTRWGDQGRVTARRNLWLDVPFIAGYSAGLSALLSWSSTGVQHAAWCWTGHLTCLVAWLTFVAGVFDVIENYCLLVTLSRFGDPARSPGNWATRARTAALLKFTLLIVSFGWAVLVVAPLLIP
jgi:hypothetical protein